MATGVHHVVGDVELEFKEENLPATSKRNGFSFEHLNGDEPVANGRSNGIKSKYTLPSFCVDEDRPMKVVVIGAGFSGIIAGIRYVTCIFLSEESLNDWLCY